MESAIRSPTDANAAHDMAVKAAEGIDVSQSWTAALDHLQRAAELGSSLAQAELAGLSSNWKLAHAILAGEPVRQSFWSRFRNFIDPTEWLKPPRSQWSQFRSSIDLTKWLTPAYSTQTISETPSIIIVRDLATPEICDWLIARARPRLERANVYAGEIASRVSEVRTNSDCVFNLPDRDLFMAILRTRLVGATQRHMRELEPPVVLNYSVGQEFQPHYDSPADPHTPGFRQRFITVLLSLNDDYEGGATAFPIAGGRWRGRKGTAIYFWNVLPDGTRDDRSLHAGLPITQGEKWMMTQFITRPKSAPP